MNETTALESPTADAGRADPIVLFFSKNCDITNADASVIGLAPGYIPAVDPETGAPSIWKTILDDYGDVECWQITSKSGLYVIFND